MRTLFVATLDRAVRNEPRIATTTQIAPARVLPTGDVALVLIRHAQGEAIDFGASGLREVKNVFVASFR